MARNSKVALLSDGDLADELGNVKAHMAPLASREAEIKAEIKARGIAVAEGKLFRVTNSPVPQMRLDTERLKQKWPAVYRDCSFPSTVERITCSARRGKAAA